MLKIVSPPNMTSKLPARLFFIEMMGVPGSYDPSVYDHFEDKDDEGQWFIKRFGQFPDITIETRNVCIGQLLPEAYELDGLVLAGSYNSVHDDTDWQQQMRSWLPTMIECEVPLLGVCGSHQLIAHMHRSDVTKVEGGPFAGTFPVQLTNAGNNSPIMHGITSEDCFQFANGEHVIEIPMNSTLLATSSKVPVAALDYGHHCYTTQFHPEGSCESLSTVWRNSFPELMSNYHHQEKGEQLVRNFLQIVVDRTRSR